MYVENNLCISGSSSFITQREKKTKTSKQTNRKTHSGASKINGSGYGSRVSQWNRQNEISQIYLPTMLKC